MPRTSTHIFRARLPPRVYRDIEIESTKPLHDLAAAIVQAFDFDFDHAFGFYSNLKGDYYRSEERYERRSRWIVGPSSPGTGRWAAVRHLSFPDGR